MRRGKRRVERMRAVVDCLPYETKLAMVEGLERYEIIAGAYSDRQGRVCPMLAAHRCGGRTDLRSFARAWDGYTGVGRRSRRASERELRTLRAQLEQSIWDEERKRDELTRPAPATPERDAPARSAKRKLGAWLLPARSWDEYRRGVGRALGQADRRADAAGKSTEDADRDTAPPPREPVGADLES